MWKRIMIYSVIGIYLTVVPLYYMDNVLFADSAVAFNPISKLLPEINNRQLKLPAGAKFISMLYNQEYIAYVDSGTLQIDDVKKGGVYRTISEDSDILYAVPMEDRNIVIYFTYEDNKLWVKTYDFDRDDKTDHKSISIKNFYKVKDVRYSSLTNVIYIDAETNDGKTLNDKIYRVDIMKDVTLYSVNKGISNLILLNNQDTIVYADDGDNIYIKGKQFKFQNNRKFKLLGIDEYDRVYISPSDNRGDVLVVKDGNVLETLYISDTSYIKSLNRGNKIYLVYSDRIFDLTNNKVIKKNADSSVIDINNSTIIYDNGRNDIVIERFKM